MNPSTSAAPPVTEMAVADVPRPAQGGPTRLIRKLVLSLICVVLIAVAGQVVPPYYQYIFVLAGVYSLAVLGNNLLLSHVGLLSIGQGALVAVGAYTTAIASQGGIGPVESLVLGVAAAMFAGFVVGLPAVRLRSHYLALVTLAFALALAEALGSFPGVTGGATGLAITENIISSDVLYFVTFGLLAIVLLTQELALAGRLGRTLHIIRDSPQAAASFGVRVARYKLGAFMYSGAMAGLAGGLMVSLTAYVSPTTYDLFLSIYIMAAVVMAGMSSPLAAVGGAFVIAGVPQLTTTTAGAAPIILGAVLLLMIMLHHFVVPALARAWRRRGSTQAGGLS
jgi:branched-chain amino acid transport system permease protein